ncbi:hypothetical protein TheetDRAFT_1277 [Thermoanaerobacter ethanolicus JW 200]|uniref:hypothetical protein n=1 Tax=Thermoanaerobacter ethanolicus TaxID=1757 RepID=UPI000202C7DD|nr:hypothetical protein TheetDRAFT_1277 [Thermoanaerobacter ethanolicus JW 200]
MSNHSGSYMLNDVLKKLDELNVFEFLGREKTVDFLKWVCNYTYFTYDTNAGEILEEIGAKLKFCYYCCEGKDDVDETGLCGECRREMGYEN